MMEFGTGLRPVHSPRDKSTFLENYDAPCVCYTAAPRQKGITDNFVKIELSLSPDPK